MDECQSLGRNGRYRSALRGTGRVRLVVAVLTTLAVALTASPALAAEDVIAAARAGDVAAVRALVADGADVDVRQGDGATALHWAAHRGDLVLAEALLAAGADVNAANALDATPLWLASQNGDARLVAVLLAAGADANVSLKMGETPLMSASRSGSVDSVERLLAAGADVNAAERERGQTALMWAAAQGHAGVVGLLAAAGADLHARSRVSGASSRILSNALAAPVGPRLPCSQLRMVSCGTSMRRANSTCVSPRRRRTRRAKRPMSRIASASSSRAWQAMSSSPVASSTSWSTRPTGPSCGLSGSIVNRVPLIFANLPADGLAGRNDADRRASHGVDHHEHPTLHRAQEPVAVLAVVPAPVRADYPVRVEECVRDVREVEAAIRETGVALGVVPLELHALM